MSDKKIYLTGIFLALSISYEDKIVLFGYIAIAFFCAVALMFHVRKVINKSTTAGRMGSSSKARNCTLSTPLLLSLLVIASWFYGVTVGAFGGVKSENLFRNFSGLILYLLYPIYLIIRPDPFSVSRIILTAGMVQLLVALCSFKPELLLASDAFELASISDVRSSYSTGYIIIFPLFAASCGLLFFDINGQIFKNKMILSFILTAALFSLTVVTASKGFILAALVLLFLIGAAWFRSIKISLLLSFTALILFVPLFFYAVNTDFFDLMILSFSFREGGNAIREEQALALMNELSILGAGLGSPLLSGYKRDDTGYGFELTYLNLVHKLGFFSIPIFSLYIYTFIKSLSWLISDFKNIFPYICLGGCCYMIVGIGNPILLSSLTVTLHCSILYLLLKMKETK
jgi:hypothetical protein